MNQGLKSLLKAVAAGLSLPLRLLPASIRRGLIAGLLLSDSRIGTPDNALRRLFRLQDDVERLINERAMAYGNGEHPKHRLTRYHDFFVERIPDASQVLDIGCGYGAVARSIASRVKDAVVTGIDMDEPRLTQARQANNPDNLTFVFGDALTDLPPKKWDVVVLSNVLEHIEDRVPFLQSLHTRIEPDILLLRVPLYERNWQIPMRDELDMPYFSDSTHFIEHKLLEFEDEIRSGGYVVTYRQTLWGEIWAECRPTANA
jgi:SAM-dependent methyltransferase